MSRAHAIVVGGGLAGLQAGVACADAGLRVTLLEARPRLGGATWSSERDGLWVDNGQHVFLGCCTAYRGFLQRLGVADRVTLQPRLSLPVRSPERGTAWLRRQSLPAPFHLVWSLLRFQHLSLGERLRVARSVLALGRLDLADPALDRRSLGGWLESRGEPARVIDGFFDLLIRPTVNVPARDASLALAAKVFQTGLLEATDHADIGWANVPLQALHAEPGAAALEASGGVIRRRARVEAVRGGGRPGVRLGGDWLDADAVVLATPHEVAADLLPPEAGIDPADLRKLGHAPIVNLHVVYDRAVLGVPFLAGLATPVEWVFDRSASSGLSRGQYLAVSLSAAERWVGVSQEALRRSFVPALEALLPGARDAQIVRFFSTCERSATFRQVPGTAAFRQETRTGVGRLYLAGAWTDTGWPATMEGAVRSGQAAARAAIDDLQRETQG